ncbi:MAG: hypothetical protein WBC77_05505, partial [Candidatus Zixiibacteriota bacterium]
MKKRLREYGLNRNSIFPGALLVFVAFCALSGSGAIFEFLGSVEDFAPISQLGGKEALASTNDFQEAFAETLYDDSLIVVDTSAAPGESFWLTVDMVSTILTYGFELAFFDYDRSIISPDTFCIVDTTYDPLTPPYIFFDTTWYPTYEMLGRADRPDSTFFLIAASFWNQHLDTLRFTCLVDFLFADPPEPPIDPGSGPVVRFKFWVREDAQPGSTTPIRFVTVLPVPGFADIPPNFTDTEGNFKIPMTVDGTFTVGDTTEPENHCPVFTYPVSDYFEVYEGVTLEFDVTATDEDGDTITLTMDPLDPDGLNYNFVPQIGEAVVTSRFDYTPAYDEYPATRYVRFRATDGQCPVTKTVEIKVLET